MAQSQHRSNEESWLSPFWGGHEASNIPAGLVSDKAEQRTGAFIPMIWWASSSLLQPWCQWRPLGKYGRLDFQLYLAVMRLLFPRCWSGSRGVLVEIQASHHHPAGTRPCLPDASGNYLGSQSACHCSAATAAPSSPASLWLSTRSEWETCFFFYLCLKVTNRHHPFFCWSDVRESQLKQKV